MFFTVDMVKPLRDKAGMSREELALKVGVTYRTVLNWEQAEQPVRIQKAVRDNLIKLWKREMVS